MREQDGARLARRLREQFPSLESSTILERVAAERQITISRFPFSRGVSGIMCMAAGGPQIGISSLSPPEHQLFTLAHELGHALLGHRAGLLARVQASSSLEDERQANAFAAEFLMPAERVSEWVADGMTVQLLCQSCGVSFDTMAARLAELDLWAAAIGPQNGDCNPAQSPGQCETHAPEAAVMEYRMK